MTDVGTSSTAPMRVAVSGSTGLIGSALARLWNGKD
jgi:hypothetical protein